MKRMLWAAVLAVVACAPAERPAQKEWRGAFVTVQNEDGSEVPPIDMDFLEENLKNDEIAGTLEVPTLDIAVHSLKGSCGDYRGSFTAVVTIRRPDGSSRTADGNGTSTMPTGLFGARPKICSMSRADAIRKAALRATRKF